MLLSMILIASGIFIVGGIWCYYDIKYWDKQCSSYYKQPIKIICPDGITREFDTWSRNPMYTHVQYKDGRRLVVPNALVMAHPHG